MRKLGSIACFGLLAASAFGAAWQPVKDKPLPTPGPTNPAKPMDPASPATPPPATAPSTTPSPASPASPTPTKSAPSTPGRTAPTTLPLDVPPPDAGGKGGLVDLRPKFQVGRAWTLKLTNAAENTTVMPSGSGLPGDPTKPGAEDASVSKVDQDFVLVFRPTAVSPEGDATVEVVFQSIAMRIESDAMTDSFDSTKPAKPAAKPTGDPLKDLAATPMLEQTLRPLVGDTLTLTVDPHGNVTKVEGGDKFAALFSGPGGMPGGSGSAKGLFGSIFTTSKTRPKARVGDRWSTQDVLDLSMAGTITLNTDYSLKSARAGRATIGVDGKMQSASRNPTPGMPFVIKECSHSGECEWNTDDGFVQSMDSTQKLSIDMSVGGMAGRANSVQKTKVRRIP